ncbi:Methyltransferase type 12 [Chthoniobacter flavus Ellin428]|uniref:Methyltransferase type 12 n=1 Tax=Chthoniobacter flavus Ellin428 TaxID=497964 RepID=B4DCD3_9BACT|nr:class I SAM-dependent methyltransferase [Chthoniobacter flavus]EDY15882.1 Methyltransferase type 12 [Chthoniobacter flavus Ellin428]TCO87413.1 S-adenosylmethionine-diacylgycerolhomoserine-N-methyltransferase [Chthoniobacter flavus]
MNADASTSSDARGETSIEGYYRWHARIYDATRWSFLFGRTGILHEVAKVPAPARILEVGCGTGKNLVTLGRLFPQAEITGIDLSETMLDVARRKAVPFGSRIQLLHGAYGATQTVDAGYDLILFSYALSMFNPGFEAAIETAHRDLVPGGHVAVVDFHDTPLSVFERWMGVNHVRMSGQLRPPLQARFEAREDRLEAAFGGVWRYLVFVGRKG